MDPRPAALAGLFLVACAPAKVAWSEAAPRRPEVFLDILPRSALVWVDGRAAGAGPLTVRIEGEAAKVLVSAPGFEPSQVTLEARRAGGRVGLALRPSGFGAGRPVDADEPGGLAGASVWLLRSGKAADAEAYAERAVEVAPSAPAPRRALGMALAKLGQGNRAAQELSTYLQLTPSAPDQVEIEGMVTRLRRDIAIPAPRN